MRNYETDLERRKRIISERAVLLAIRKLNRPTTRQEVMHIFWKRVSYPYSMVKKHMSNLEKKGCLVRSESKVKRPHYFEIAQELNLGVRI